ncbi:hypothetical protein [Acetobacterium sp. KB-1]|uniref:hypothetical protein n=1 Tax=Acetobacterium sp. KB-1 TaxID=2184575 RepID=UPI000DBEB24C|nr:hypothetical protein DOZ58_04360 [Acetobacterium sp. KB-1]
MKKRQSRVDDEVLFTRLLYYGTVHLNRTENEVWLMPLGQLLDLWTCHKQFLGIKKPQREWTIDEIIPEI